MLSLDLLRSQKIAPILLRVSMGWLMLYAGIAKMLDPEWLTYKE